MAVAALLALALATDSSLGPASNPPFVSALGRPLAWDPKGAYALDADEPLTPVGRRIVEDLMAAELGRAEALARGRLSLDKEDLVPAWALTQVLRVRKTALLEYHRAVERQAASPASTAVLLYRLHVCRLAEAEMPSAQRGSKSLLWRGLEARLQTLRDRLRPTARRRLGVAIAITGVTPYWAVTNRTVLEEYREAHPKGVDVRALLCQAYLSGVVSKVFTQGPGHSLVPDPTVEHRPEEPRTDRGIEVARSILKDRPNDPLGHYYAGVGQSMLGHPDLARREFQAALAAGGLPPAYAQGARSCVDNPAPSAFWTKVVY